MNRTLPVASLEYLDIACELYCDLNVGANENKIEVKSLKVIYMPDVTQLKNSNQLGICDFLSIKAPRSFLKNNGSGCSFQFNK